MTTPETYGELRSPDGTVHQIVALFTIFRDDREVTIGETDAGTIVVSTKSWLRCNNRECVQFVNHYTRETLAMMAECIMLGAEYLGIDLAAESQRLHASDGELRFEYAGRGEPDFSKHTTPITEETK